LRNAKSANIGTVKSCLVTLEDIANKENLYEAYCQTRKGKRDKDACFEFERELTQNIDALHKSILSGTYRPSDPHKFVLYCKANKKYRNIAAPKFKDCVVQHAIYRLIYSSIDRRMIYDSYGCRVGKGTHKAADRCQKYMRQCGGDECYLQIDMKKYYNRMRHDILEESFSRIINDVRVVQLIMEFPKKDSESGIGMNIGNLISQLCGILYLDRFDHYAKRVLKIKRYIRYVDDIVMFGMTKKQANKLLIHLKHSLLNRVGMILSKWKISRVSKGINFVGYRTWRSRRFIRKRSLHTFSKALKKKQYQKIVSILAHTKHTSSYAWLINRVIDAFKFKEFKQNLPKRLYHDLLFYYLQRRRAIRNY